MGKPLGQHQVPHHGTERAFVERSFTSLELRLRHVGCTVVVPDQGPGVQQMFCRRRWVLKQLVNRVVTVEGHGQAEDRFAERVGR
jgi:hypothetical protein